MKKYMVIDVCEREIGEPKFFYTDAWCETPNHDNWDGKIIEIDLPTLF